MEIYHIYHSRILVLEVQINLTKNFYLNVAFVISKKESHHVHKHCHP